MQVLYLYAISPVPERCAARSRPRESTGRRGRGYPLRRLSLLDQSRFEKRICRQLPGTHAGPGMAGDCGTSSSARCLGNLAASPALPARFGTVFLSEDSLRATFKGTQGRSREAFAAGRRCRRMGHQGLCHREAKARVTAKAASGADYLKRKAELLQPRTGKIGR